MGQEISENAKNEMNDRTRRILVPILLHGREALISLHACKLRNVVKIIAKHNCETFIADYRGKEL